MEIYNRNIKFLRSKYLCLSQAKFADILGVARSTVHAYETGTDPGSVKIVFIAKKFKIDLITFYETEMTENNISNFFLDKVNFEETKERQQERVHCFKLIDKMRDASATDEEREQTSNNLKEIYFDQLQKILSLYSSQQTMVKAIESNFGDVIDKD